MAGLTQSFPKRPTVDWHESDCEFIISLIINKKYKINIINFNGYNINTIKLRWGFKMFWLKLFIILFIFVVFLIILIPYRYKISGSYYEDFEGGIYIYPLFGILVITFKVSDSNKNLTFEFLTFKKEIKATKLKKETKKIKTLLKF